MKTFFIVVAVCVLAVSLFGSEKLIIKLPEPDKTGGKPLMQCLDVRKSERTYSAKQIDLKTLSNILYAACGINRQDGKRTAPSALNKQNISVYVGLPEGTYVYNATIHSLELVSEKDLRSFFGVQSHFKNAPVTLAYVADVTKYDEYADLFSMANSGFIGQNVFLYCASEGLSTVVCASIDHAEFAKALGLPEHMKIQLSQPVGYPAE